ncbi:MAG: hypothetical protein MUF23_12785 [Pirellula sp.]|nr:hypothetical protein [Pirellula sp.]
MKSSHSYPLPTPIRDKLSELRGLISRLIACQGWVMLGIWSLAAFWLFGLLDYLPTRFGADESPRIVRAIMLTILIAGILAILYHFFWNRWLVRWSDASLALAIEKQHPEFKSSLITTVQAAASVTPGPGQSTNGIDPTEHPLRPGVLSIAREDAESRIAQVDVSRLVRFQSLQRELIGFAAIAAISCVVMLLAPKWTWHWGQRLFALSDLPWPRTTQLGLIGIELDVPSFSNQTARERYMVSFRDSEVRVPKGSSCQLKVWAENMLAAPYDTCALHYRDMDGNRGRANLRRGTKEGERQNFLLDGPPLESINDSLALSLSGGDARIGNLSLTAVEAPLIATSYIDVTYPEYLQQSTKTIWGKEQLAYRNGIRLPQGSHIELILETNKPIQRCDLLRVRSNEEAEVAESITQLEQAQPSKTLKLPLGVLDGNLLIEVRLWDDEGLCSTRVQPFVIASITDIAPSVDFVLEGIGTAITEQALLQVRSKITDDYDLKEAWIETIIDEQPTQKTPLAITAQGEANIDIDLKAMRDSGANTPKVGSVLALMVSAADFLPLPDTIHVGKSTPIQLNVVTPDQLLVILERRELAMRARLEQIISELGQLRDLLAVMNRPIEPIQESQNEGDAAPEDPIARQMRLLVLRSQQASAQADKSGGELKGVRSEIGQVLAELIHNRIDSKDRRDRLEQKIQRPLITLLEGSWETFAKGISELELFVSKAAPEDRTRRVEALMLQNNEIIAALTTILNDMIDIQDFNEVIDMVRDMLEDQNQVLEQTKAEQKRRLLEALK